MLSDLQRVKAALRAGARPQLVFGTFAVDSENAMSAFLLAVASLNTFSGSSPAATRAIKVHYRVGP